MRFYPDADINHYWEFPSGWSIFCRNPAKSWKRKPLQAKHAIIYWRDLEGAKTSSINDTDLYFKSWPNQRVRPEACLPLYYCVGNRFIRLEKAFPVGFKCSPLPMSLKEVRELKSYERQTAKRKRAEAKEAKKLAEKQEALDRKKKGLRV